MKKKFLVSFIIIVFVLVVIIPIAIGLATDWLWFSAQGYIAIFTTVLLTKLILGVIAGLATFSILYLNFYIAYRRTKDQPVALNNLQSQRPGFDLSKIIYKLLLPISLAIGLLTGIAGSSYWQVVQQFINGVSFNAADPLFGRDISFYFFTLPFIKMAIGFLFWIIIISILGAASQYLIRGSLIFKGKRFLTARTAKNHLSALMAIFFISIAGHVYFINMTNLLYTDTGTFTGANYTDIYARLPVLWGLLSIALLIAAAFIINTFRPIKRLAPSLIIIYIAVAILGGSVYPSIIQKLVVLPNELIKETPYIER
ncbi:UPF0182 family protein, partial [Patescibacteria group bacterium]|nr:UPF0182 family protein [Patescibacteria group bacterium]